MNAISTQADELQDFDFRFYMEPYELPPDNEANYCKISDFAFLLSANAQSSLKNFLWAQFRLHRAVDALQKIYLLFERSSFARKIEILEGWEPEDLIHDILMNI